MPVFAAFYRYMNLGHPRNPSRAQLERALQEAGASSVRSFQTNGTVVFEAADGESARAIVDRAAPELNNVSGYVGVAFVRPLDELAATLDRKPFEDARDSRTYRETFTFFDGGKPFDLPLPWTNRRGDLDLLEVGQGMALAIVRKKGNTSGNPTTELEALLGVPASTRTAGTIERMLGAHR